MPVPSPVQNIRVTAGGVVQPPQGVSVFTGNDLLYHGCMRVPATGVRMDFAYGQMTGRRVNGQVHLLMTGNQPALHGPVYEFADTGSYNPVPSSAPRMALVNTWPDIYQGKRASWDANGQPVDTSNWSVGGFHWSEAKQLLYWTYYNSYNVSGFPDWSLGATKLLPTSAVSYGPWRVFGGGKYGPWRCVHLTEHPQTGEMLCGSMLMSGNANAVWGPDVWNGTLPTETTPGGYGQPDLPVNKYLTYYPIFSQIHADGSWTGTIKSCLRPGDYLFEPLSNTGHSSIDPTKNNGIGSWNELDTLYEFTWIELPTKRGVIFTGKFAAAHEWYSNPGNNYTCFHGVPSPVQITGPVSTDAYPFIGIFDPADLEAVHAGTKTDYTVQAHEWINAATRWNTVVAPVTFIGSSRSFTGHYFDAVGKKLYIAAPEADATQPGWYLPLVHVFTVNG